MRRIRLAELAVFILLGASITVSAHDFWLVPNAFMINPGESLIISANTGMDFPNSLSAVTPDRLDRFVLIGESRRENLSEFTVQGNSLTARCAV
jgi:hypothetical protein